MSSHDALMVASGITTVLDAVAIGDVRDGGDRLENLEKMINAVEETQSAASTAPSIACICAASCRITPPCRCLKSWLAASR
jgi:alpha-D-ribose 1-methylphosphonate 5-triphosphate diphosphatase